MNAIQMTLQDDSAAAEMLFSFIDHYMPQCKPETYALIYIYTFRQYSLGGSQSISLPDIAEIFNVKEDFIVGAWRHWEEEGLLKLTHKNGGVLVNISLNDLPETKTNSKIAGEIKPVILSSDRPQYTVEELTVYRQKSSDIEQLFSSAEKSLGQLLTYNDMNTLFGLYDWLRLPLDVILYLLAYCADHGHRNLRYIEKAALDWADNGIDDLEKALAYVQGFDRNYRRILQAMGQTTGYPTPSQRKYINKWLNTYQFSVELIMEACDRAAIQIGKPKFTYVDKMVEDWYKKGIKTVAEVESDAADFRNQSNTEKKETPKTQKKNRFANFKQREWDFEQLEKMEREYLAQTLKG